MICVFDSEAQHYVGAGLGIVPDWISANVIRERNGAYYFEGEYIVGGENADVLQIDNVIQTSAGQRTKRQWFDIVKITQKDNKTFVVYAEHISYRLKKMVLLPNATVSGNGNLALQGWLNSIIVPGHGFNTWSNVETNNQTTFRIDKVPNARLALGGAEDSILAKWGGEYEFDNFTIKLWENMGRKQPTRIIFGKNLLSLEDSQTSENSYTHLMPYVIKNNRIYTLPNNEFIAWNTLGTQVVRVLPVDFSEHFKGNPNIVKPDEEPQNSTNDTIDIPEDNSTDSGSMGEAGETKEAKGGHWARDSKGWWFVFKNGKYPKNRWVKIDGKWYRFKKNGYMYENQWFKDKDGTRYYLGKTGAMVIGWTAIKNRWRYFDKDGAYDSTAKKEFELDESKLRKLAEEYVKKNNHYTYEFQTTVKYVDLSKAGEGIVEEVELCDQLLVTVPDSNIDSIALKIVATKWNCLLEQYDDLTLGTLNSLSEHKDKNVSQKISSAIETAMSTIAGNQAYQFNELKGLVGLTGDNMNSVYWDEAIEPKGGFKEGDMWWSNNGAYKQLKRWTGTSWELIVDTEDPKKMLADYEEKANTQKETLKQEINATISSAKDEATEKAYNNFKKELLNSNSEISTFIKNNLSTDSQGLEDLRTRIESVNSGLTSNIQSLNLELTNTNSTLWTKIRANNQGILTEFKNNELQSALGVTSSGIMRQVNNLLNGNYSSFQQRLDSLKSTITQETVASTVEQLGDKYTTQINDIHGKVASHEVGLNSIRQSIEEANKKAEISISNDGIRFGSGKIVNGQMLASMIALNPDNAQIIANKTKVTGDMIVNGAITGNKIAANSITGGQIVSGSIKATHLAAGAISADKISVTNAFVETIASNTAFLNKLFVDTAVARQVKAKLIEGYKGVIGGFQIGTINNYQGKYITGENQFSVGMSNGHTKTPGGAALWVNWGKDWNKFPANGWVVDHTGKMYAYNGAAFKNGVSVTGPLYVEVNGGELYYKGNKLGDLLNKKINMTNVQHVERKQDANGPYIVFYSNEGNTFARTSPWSDKRLKSNIQSSNVDALHSINQLNIYEYDFEKDNTKYHKQIGLIAQEIGQFLPDAHESFEGMETYSPFFFVPYLVKAIQQLSTKVEVLERKLNNE